MDVVEFTPTVEQYAFTFGGNDPAMRVQAGLGPAVVVGRRFRRGVAGHPDVSSEKVDLRFVNPQTGPFYVEGAEPGDTLALHLVSLEPARDWGASAAIPFFGGMTSTDRTVSLQDPLPDTTWIYHLDSVARTLASRPGSATCGSSFRWSRCSALSAWPRPVREVRSSLVPERFGGNMDTPQMRAGATCYLGVNVEGRMFSIGDGHYRQGEGEACGTAVEGAMTRR